MHGARKSRCGALARHPAHVRTRAMKRILFAAALGAACASALADQSSRVPLLPAYRQECAACHVAYPPGLLPAASWQRLMDGLPRHFGTDASLEPAQVRELSAWLAANAATARRAEPPPEDRITRGAW